MTRPSYRPDIDGLRAIAVMLVILFHAGLGVPGGFVGVDVFFVISGFLITQLILKSQESQSSWIISFWSRRVRRIAPLAILAATVTLVIGYFILLPDEYDELARSAIAQQLMVSNIFFWRHTGYFAGPADFKPLLHTWSLSVEEQFYLGYPFLVMSLKWVSKRQRFSVLLSLTILSLAVSEYGAHYHRSATFYLLPTRAWELLLGGLICFAPPIRCVHRVLFDLVALIALAAIVGPAFCFDNHTPFPGIAALIPCLGTAAFIAVNSSFVTLLGRLASLRPVVFVGLLSYSLYLWHWPILAFFRLYHSVELGVCDRLAAVAVTFVVSVLSWRFIETPIRKQQFLVTAKAFWGTFVSFSLCIVVMSVFIHSGCGFPGRFDSRALGYLSSRGSLSDIFEFSGAQDLGNGLPTFGRPQSDWRLLAWGDSHAMALIPGLRAACFEACFEGVQVTHSSVPPLLSDGRDSEWRHLIVDFAHEKKCHSVVLAANWEAYFGPTFEADLLKTIHAFHSRGIHVIVIRDIPIQNGDTPRLLINAVLKGQTTDRVGVSLVQHIQNNSQVNIVFDRIALAEREVIFVDPTPCFDDGNGFLRAEFEGVSMYRDRDHLSIEGSLRLRPLFLETFEQLRGRSSN
jgi:peptidoglycan/LPS O-acetylase OafA/YrhL